ncbi:glycoside hydrolase family 55 protein [Spirosoma sp. RP8]|uniref:Glycoside hydrolase family 55 protein n=1 Tax=Spirosoma liriopis TaxID=2937440 RepID=A0ABT0HL35_9BACT|nr:glycoside hydrolase family 55 protein [Spirosoma liriopis]MCK8492305.1 glycoside hydrolase family 55 protein [Spirosoma liriopis]
MPINVKDSQFGAVGDGSKDDAAAIQKAIDFAKTRSANPYAPYLTTVYFPAGYYLVGSPINLTNATGIWLVGDGGSYLNTVILGITGNQPMFDFSGSSYSGCENFTFLPAGNASNSSTIGVQFARTNNGGLNCGIKKCYFQMADNASANGGLGSIGLLNIRSEEFYIHECVIRANAPLILSYTSNIAVIGVNYTASSSYQALLGGTGSMGVTDITGTSLQAIEKRLPAMILLGTNTINFQGYLSRLLSSGSGSNETAILCATYTTNLRVHATIESFSRAVQVLNSALENCDLNLVVANSTTPNTELVDVTNCFVSGLRLSVSQPVSSERNRIVIYHAPVANNTQQAVGSITNSEITCSAVPSNEFIISANLLKRSTNVLFNTLIPFEKRSGRIRQLTNSRVSFGTVGSITSASILQFREARLTNVNNNSGHYRFWIDGTIKAGGYGSGKAASLSFQAQIIVNQRYDGVLDPFSSTVITLDQSSTDPSYLSISGIVANLTFTNNIGSITLLPRVLGNGTGEPVYYEGFVEFQSDFFINDPFPLT